MTPDSLVAIYGRFGARFLPATGSLLRHCPTADPFECLSALKKEFAVQSPQIGCA